MASETEPRGEGKTKQRTGHPIVDEITTMRFKGIVIDHRWIGHPWLCHTDGKKVKAGLATGFDRDAAYVLAEICYFYSARIEKDSDDHILRVEKRFDGETMYQDYAAWSKKLGCTDRELRLIIAFLRDKGVIGFESKPVVLRNGFKTNNLPHIWPIAEKIYELTFGKRDDLGGGASQKSATPPPKNFTSAENSDSASQKNAGGVAKKRDAICTVLPSVGTKQQQQGEPPAAVVGNADAFNGEQSPVSISNSSLPQNIGGAAAEVENEWTPLLLEQVAARLLGLRTGCSKAALRRYLAETTPAHAAFVAEHFPNEPENDDAHWEGRKGSRAAALVTRLRDVEWEPRNLQAKRREDERKAQARAVAARRAEEEAEAARRKTEESEYVRKQAVEAMRQFGSMPKKTREAIGARVRERAAWLTTKAPDGDLDKIVVGSQLWMSLAATTQVAMREIALEKPQLPGLAQLAPGEVEHEYSSGEPSENIIEPPPLASDELAIRLIERLATGIRDGVYDLDEIAEQREKNLLDGAENDALWAQIESGIRERLVQEKAA